jgi:hypothetical protein
MAFKKGDIVLKRHSEHKGCIYVLLNAELKGSSIKYEANTIIEPAQLLDKRALKIK